MNTNARNKAAREEAKADTNARNKAAREEAKADTEARRQHWLAKDALASLGHDGGGETGLFDVTELAKLAGWETIHEETIHEITIEPEIACGGREELLTLLRDLKSKPDGRRQYREVGGTWRLILPGNRAALATGPREDGSWRLDDVAAQVELSHEGSSYPCVRIFSVVGLMAYVAERMKNGFHIPSEWDLAWELADKPGKRVLGRLLDDLEARHKKARQAAR